jgi:mRNA interferase YafQ
VKEVVLAPRFVAELRARKRRLGGQIDLDTLEHVIELLADEQPLPGWLRDHPLHRDYAGLRECHLDDDWLLVYRISAAQLRLLRIGSHAELFGRR